MGSAMKPGWKSAEEKSTHNTDAGALDCWCMPRYLRPCDECGVDIKVSIHCDDIATRTPPCWKCVNGTIALTREEAETADFPLIIVHKEEEE